MSKHYLPIDKLYDPCFAKGESLDVSEKYRPMSVFAVRAG